MSKHLDEKLKKVLCRKGKRRLILVSTLHRNNQEPFEYPKL